MNTVFVVDNKQEEKMLTMKKKFIPLSLLLFLSVMLLVSCQQMRKDAGEQIQYQQAQTAHNEGDFVKAIRIYKKLIAQDPDNEGYVYDLAMAYLDSKDFDGAKEQIAQLKKMDHADLADKLETFMGQAKGLDNK